ncbi:hypothetical protein [Paenibacillus xylanilyticus]|uniref:hypothetical protein n=1 Tax=Paenibacillus xylanilyticus TaxID=248903 RepID=UPI0039A1A14A
MKVTTYEKFQTGSHLHSFTRALRFKILIADVTLHFGYCFKKSKYEKFTITNPAIRSVDHFCFAVPLSFSPAVYSGKTENDGRNRTQVL